MKARDYSEPVHAMWSIWEALRRLGFSSDEISFEAHPTIGVPMALFVILRSQGREFSVTAAGCGSVNAAQRHYDSFLDFCERLNAGEFPEEELQEIFDRSKIRNQATTLVVALMNKGFVLDQGKDELVAKLTQPGGVA